jgi:uncharacterized protein
MNFGPEARPASGPDWTPILRAAFSVVGLLLVAGAVAVVVLVLVLTQRGVNEYIRPPRTVASRNPLDLGMGYADLPLVTEDGVNLAAWFIPGSRADTLILVHGLGSNRGEMLPLAADLHARGYGLLLLDLRAHGDSQGDVSTLGVKEVRDVRAALAYLSIQPDVDARRIGIYGASLGGAVALQAAAQLPALDGVVTDSTFASVRWAVDHQLQALLKLPNWFGLLLLHLGAFEAGIQADDASPERAAAHLGQRPLLVIHGADDDVFQVENARLIAAAASGPHELWIVDGAGHTGAYSLAPAAYAARLDRFFTAAASRG